MECGSGELCNTVLPHGKERMMFRKWLSVMLILALGISAAGCGKDTGKVTSLKPTETLSEEALQKLDADAEHKQEEYPQLLMARGQLYYNTGELSQVTGRCGVMDGQITDSVESTEKPTKDGQSNFGTGYGYQYMDDTIEVYMEDNWYVFKAFLEETEDMYSSLRAFSYELFAQNIDDENPVLSPLSAYIALSMAAAGAEGDTLAEIDEVLGLYRESISLEFMKKLSSEDEILTLNVANSAWLDDMLTAEDSWLQVLDAYFQAEGYQVDLASPAAMLAMNQWIEEKTNGLIREFLSEPLSDQAVFALINAVYMHAKWVNAFEEHATFPCPFTLADQTTIQTDMMHQTAYFDYFHDERMEGVILPYRNTSLAFVAVKPTAGQTVRQLYEEACLPAQSGEDNGCRLQELIKDQAESAYVHLSLPKFEVSFDRELSDALIDMGLSHAFDPALADFGGIGSIKDENSTGMNRIFISLVRQKAVVKVDEEGTEAAAVTMVVAETTEMIEPEPVLVTFDEPFLYLIVDMETQVPLFVGIIDDPS